MPKKLIGLQCNKCGDKLTKPRFSTCTCKAVSFDKGEITHRLIGKKEDYTPIYKQTSSTDSSDTNSVL